MVTPPEVREAIREAFVFTGFDHGEFVQGKTTEVTAGGVFDRDMADLDISDAVKEGTKARFSVYRDGEFQKFYETSMPLPEGTETSEVYSFTPDESGPIEIEFSLLVPSGEIVRVKIATLAVYVKPSTADIPEADITLESLSVSPSNPIVGEELTVDAVVKNNSPRTVVGNIDILSNGNVMGSKRVDIPPLVSITARASKVISNSQTKRIEVSINGETSTDYIANVTPTAEYDDRPEGREPEPPDEPLSPNTGPDKRLVLGGLAAIGLGAYAISR
jgi:hypothetical protein